MESILGSIKAGKVMHSIESLPKWAQALLNKKENEINRLQAKVTTLQQSMDWMTDGKREWFTLRGPYNPDKRERYTLYILNQDAPHAVCTLNHKDMLIVGRALK